MQKIILFTNKVYINIKLDFLWLFTKQEFYLKFKYYFSKYYNIFFDKKSIQYLGEEFYYDNRFTPALLQSYPLEINNISKIIDFDNLDSVLDIGGNLGQFSISLNHYYRNLKINSFEPNTETFNLYKKKYSK